MDFNRLRFGRYEVLGPIGEGGMGEVYVARDPDLGRRVAIKKLPLRFSGDRETLARFTQEARSASALNHPNIVTIHEVGAEDGTPYIVMEYIEGADLRSLVSGASIPIRKLLDIGAQIADGLAAAHERGIVHRDLKPENLMITRDGFVKILDFGLAKSMSPQPDGDNTLALELPGTNPGTILGTVGYMSPEQARGRRVDFRSDQFALGSILYELLTGDGAFEAENGIDTLARILHDDPVPVTRSRVPPQLIEIIRRLHEKKPEDRYQSTRDLARELRALRDRVVAEESGFQPSGAARAMTPRPLPALIAAGGLAVFLIVVFLIARAPRPAASSAGAAKQYLAVLGFKDLSGDPNGQLVVDGFAETLTARLAHYPAVQVMRPSGATAESQAADLSRVARDLGVNLVLTGTMMRNGDRIRVTYSINDPQLHREWRDLIEGSVTDLFAVQDDVAASVAKNLQLGSATPKRLALAPNVSQRRYLEALGHLRRYDSDQSVDRAIAILKELGDSPSVQSALARAYLYKFQITREPSLAASAHEAAGRALRSDPQSIDVNITMGELHRRTGRYREAIDAFVSVLSQQPTNAEAVLGLAEAYKAAGDVAKAEHQYKRAIELQPRYWGGYNKLGVFYYTQGRFEESIRQFRKVLELVPDNARGANNLGGMYQRLGRYKEALDVFSRSIEQSPSGQGYSNLGTCYYFLGRYADAAKAFEKAVELTPLDFLYWRNLGDAYRWIPGRKADAQRAYERAVQLCDAAIAVNPNEANAYLSRASALAKLGRHREARASILRALELDPQYSSNAYEAAVIANIAGSEDEAAAYLEQALRLGQNPADVLNDPEFANLKKSGRLQSIIAGFRSKSR